MELLSNLFGARRLKETIFLKDFSMNNKQLKDLESICEKVKSSKEKYIKKDINCLKAGLEGERKVYYELKNSFVPMYCLHNIRLEYKEFSAQYDFILITNKFILVLETKKLSGDIQINSSSEFVRIIRDKNRKFIRKEGMESPVSQNRKHIDILKKYLIDNGLIKYMPIKSLIVIADAKTVVDKKDAPQEVRDIICKYDNLTMMINNELKKESPVNVKQNVMKSIGDFLLKSHKEKKYNVEKKYLESNNQIDENKINNKQNKNVKNTKDEKKINDTINVKTEKDVELYNILRQYRYNKAKELGLKPYYIFGNTTLENLVESKPKDANELINIKGIGKKTIENYGQDILEHIKEFI